MKGVRHFWREVPEILKGGSSARFQESFDWETNGTLGRR